MTQDFAELYISGIDEEARGVARLGNRTVLVYCALPGEHVRARILGSKQGKLLARVVEVLESSQYRRIPFCKHACRCGGCLLQHAQYSYQLRLKRGLLASWASKLKLEIEVPKIVPSPEKYFRGRAEPQCNSKVIGFAEHGKKELVDIEECYLVSPKFSEVLQFLRKHLVPELQAVLYREGKFTGSTVVALLGIPGAGLLELAERLKEQYPEFSVVAATSSRIPDKPAELLRVHGSTHYEERLDNVLYRVPFHCFFQGNVHVFRELLRRVKKELAGEHTVYDLYCGIGTIGLYIAEEVGRVKGIEVDKMAVQAANENARLNDVQNFSAYAAKVEDALPRLELEKATAVLDPPRSGLPNTLLRFLLKRGPQRLVYISCNPVRLFCELRTLSRVYNIEKLELYDMFPHTARAEAVAYLERA